VGKGKDSGIYVDEVVDIYTAPETWDVSPSDHRVAFILNVTNSPECLVHGQKTQTVDGMVKKQARLFGPTCNSSV
jgi:hypothetical protein